jgi:hypothetical protein
MLGAAHGGGGSQPCSAHEGERSGEARSHSQRQQRDVISGETRRADRDRRQHEADCKDPLVAYSPSDGRCDERAQEVAGRIGGVHGARLRETPPEVGAHRGKQQRIGEAAEAERHRRTHREADDDP